MKRITKYDGKLRIVSSVCGLFLSIIRNKEEQENDNDNNKKRKLKCFVKNFLKTCLWLGRFLIQKVV